jgi:hypothetical protein
MSRYLRTNDEQQRKKNEREEAALTRQILAGVGGSSVYIEQKKIKKFVDTDEMK